MRHDARWTTSICSTLMHLDLHWHGHLHLHLHLHSFVVKTKMAAILGNGGGDGESVGWSIIQILARFPKSVIQVSFCSILTRAGPLPVRNPPAHCPCYPPYYTSRVDATLEPLASMLRP